MRKRGYLLLEAIVCIFLLFLASMTMFSLLSTSDQGYSQATQTRVALGLAREGLEKVRSGSTPKTVGSQNLAAVSLGLAKSTMVFTPKIVISAAGPVLLVRSQVIWSEGARTHSLELKSYVAP